MEQSPKTLIIGWCCALAILSRKRTRLANDGSASAPAIECRVLIGAEYLRVRTPAVHRTSTFPHLRPDCWRNRCPTKHCSLKPTDLCARYLSQIPLR